MATLRDQLQHIYDTHGRLTPGLLLDVARDPVNPLHDRFEWDDSVAGEAYRKQQAHALIRSVRVTYAPATEQEPEKSVRAFHAVRDGETRGYAYHPADKVAEDPFLSRLLLSEMERQWKEMYRRFHEFEQFWELIRKDGGDRIAA